MVLCKSINALLEKRKFIEISKIVKTVTKMIFNKLCIFCVIKILAFDLYHKSV